MKGLKGILWSSSRFSLGRINSESVFTRKAFQNFKTLHYLESRTWTLSENYSVIRYESYLDPNVNDVIHVLRPLCTHTWLFILPTLQSYLALIVTYYAIMSSQKNVAIIPRLSLYSWPKRTPNSKSDKPWLPRIIWSNERK